MKSDPTAPPHYMGAIDNIYGATLLGWAANLRDASRPVEVEAVEGDVIIARLAADQRREDLVASGIGTGRHGFVLALGLPFGQRKRIRVRVAGTEHYLLHQDSEYMDVEGEPPRYLGSVDAVGGCVICGWAANMREQSQPLEIEVVDGEEVLVRRLAKDFRSDLNAYKVASAEHGFEVTVPVPPDAVRTVRVRIAGTEYYLSHGDSSEIIVRGDESFHVGAIDGVDEQRIYGWAANARDPTRPLELEAIMNDEVVAVTKADLFREDLAIRGIGTGENGFELSVDVSGIVRVRITGTEQYLKYYGEPSVIVRKRGTSLPQAASPERTREKYSFYESVVKPIDGWLQRGAAIRTMDILDVQDEYGITGSFLEIGVYAGKYFSILVKHSLRTNAVALGIDPFLWSPEKAVRDALKSVGADATTNVKLLARLSAQCDVAGIIAELGEKARFISIDGSHECEDVLHDLVMSEQLLGPGGVIAVDDFINPVALGVNEAVNRFFFEPREIVPWCYVENKLFLCHREYAPRYRAVVEDIVEADQFERHSANYRDRKRKKPHMTQGRMWGSRFLLLI